MDESSGRVTNFTTLSRSSTKLTAPSRGILQKDRFIKHFIKESQIMCVKKAVIFLPNSTFFMIMTLNIDNFGTN